MEAMKGPTKCSHSPLALWVIYELTLSWSNSLAFYPFFFYFIFFLDTWHRWIGLLFIAYTTMSSWNWYLGIFTVKILAPMLHLCWSFPPLIAKIFVVLKCSTVHHGSISWMDADHISLWRSCRISFCVGKYRRPCLRLCIFVNIKF